MTFDGLTLAVAPPARDDAAAGGRAAGRRGRTVRHRPLGSRKHRADGRRTRAGKRRRPLRRGGGSTDRRGPRQLPAGYRSSCPRQRRGLGFSGGSTKVIWGAIVGGLAGTLVLTTILRGASELGLTRTTFPSCSGPRSRPTVFAPVPGDHGAHGRFDRESRERSLQLWATKRRRSLAARGLAALAAAAGLRGR